jgi:hypothetical protein
VRQRTHKYLFSLLLFVFAGGLTVLTGCSDNPDAKAAKALRADTTAALEKVGREGDYSAAQEDVKASMGRNRAKGLTQESALLASGNLAMSHGALRQADLGLMAVPLRRAVDDLEQMIRRGEQLIVEQERIGQLLASGDKEKADLQKLLEEGTDQQPSLSVQRSQAAVQMQELNAQKTALQKQFEKTQATLDDYQKQADDLLRQAELKQADEKLTLQQQGYAVLLQRKDYYVEAQATENQITALGQQIELVQARLDHLDASVKQIRSSIDAIDQSSSRQMLTLQAGELETLQNTQMREMVAGAQQVTELANGYQNEVEGLLAIYDEAAGEFEKVNSSRTQFAATLGRANAAHQAALAGSALIILQTELNESLVDLLQMTEAELAEAVQDRVPIKPVDGAFKQKTLDYFASAFEQYAQAYESAGQAGEDARCSVLKLHVLAVSQKMHLADKVADYDLANETETVLYELIARGKELGTCFTQSEAMRVIDNEGLNYVPELPLNMEVLAEGLKQRFSAWKRLPLAEQEAAVDGNLQEIENLMAKYGAALSEHLEPLRQEMVQTKERGFTEPAPSPTTSGAGDPNSL